MIYTSDSTECTKQIAADFSKQLKPGDVLCLYGDLGAGKTAFVQGLTKGLCITGHVSSPTFTIVNEYDGQVPVYHFDVYRIGDAEEMDEIGFDEYIYGNGISVIEWPQNIQEILPEKRYDITIAKDYTKEENYRIIQIEKRG